MSKVLPDTVNGATLLQFKARVVAICLQQRVAIMDPHEVETCWFMGLTPRETFEELRLEAERGKEARPEIGTDRIEFSESARGQEARYRWAKRYEELNGAPEEDDDV